MRKSSTYITLQHIAEILSFKNNQTSLASCLTNSHVDWDDIVRVSSQHLMLPALYCQLKAKNLLAHIPNDLELYLEEITTINRNRNVVLLKETEEISELFQDAKIDHVFIKGIALIAGRSFKDIGERMIGDIDILIAPHHLHQAFHLLEQRGYTDLISFSYKQENYRHLSRQINPNKVGAVELHSEVLVHKFRTLIDKNALLNRKQKINAIYVPSFEDSIRIAIYTTQINDNAHLFGYIKLKTIYDCMALGLQDNNYLIEQLSLQNHAQSFLAMTHLFFPQFKPHKTYTYSNLICVYYSFKIKYPKHGQRIHSVLRFFNAIITRSKLIVSNESYRRHIRKSKLNL